MVRKAVICKMPRSTHFCAIWGNSAEQISLLIQPISRWTLTRFTYKDKTGISLRSEMPVLCGQAHRGNRPDLSIRFVYSALLISKPPIQSLVDW